MKIGLASDHRGFELKQKLTNILNEKGYNITDFGTYNSDITDYPIYAFKLCDKVVSNEVDLGVVICGTGIGMSIACNKVKGIRCAKITNEKEARSAKMHNDANVIALDESKTIEEIINMLDIFINAQLDKDERYKRRIDLVSDYENGH